MGQTTLKIAFLCGGSRPHVLHESAP